LACNCYRFRCHEFNPIDFIYDGSIYSYRFSFRLAGKKLIQAKDILSIFGKKDGRGPI
jgi:hypothetical protein